MANPPTPGKPGKNVSAAVLYWNSLPDKERYARARKSGGRPPINPSDLVQAGYRVEEDFSISRPRPFKQIGSKGA